MVRPSDWYLVDLEGDPTPGDSFGIRQVAQKYMGIAYVAANAASVVRGMRNSHSAEAWVGDAGAVFRSETDRMPGELQKADDSYSVVADALTAWAASLEDAQSQADRGLAQARDAHADLTSAQSAYDDAHASWSTSHAQQLSQQKLQKQYQDVSPPSGTTMPTDAQLRATGRNVDQSKASMDAASASIASANARLEAAKRLVMEAKAARDDAEKTAVKAIGDAKGKAVKPSSVWEAIQDSAAWQAIVVIATVVLTIVSIVAIFVGGPLVWALIIAATALLMLNALMSIAQGKNAWGELALLAIGLIPGGRLLALAGTAGHAAIAAMALTRVGQRVVPTVVRAGEAVKRVASDLRNGVASSETIVPLVRRISDLATAVPGGTLKAIHAESGPPGLMTSVFQHAYPKLSDVNLGRALKQQPGFMDNCTNCVVATDRTLSAGSVEVAGSVGAGGAPISNVADALGGHWDQVGGYDDVVRSMSDAGDGASSVVFVDRGPELVGHVFNVIHDQNGVVFVDGQIGQFARLEPFERLFFLAGR